MCSVTRFWGAPASADGAVGTALSVGLYVGPRLDLGQHYNPGPKVASTTAFQSPPGEIHINGNKYRYKYKHNYKYK